LKHAIRAKNKILFPLTNLTRTLNSRIYWPCFCSVHVSFFKLVYICSFSWPCF